MPVQHALVARVGIGHGRDEALRIGLLRRGADLLGRAEFDDLAAMHHGHAVAEIAYHRNVVRNEDEAEVQPLADIEQQVEDLAADRDVERRGRLVGDDDARIERQRPGDADALALAARKGVRITLHAPSDRGRPVASVRRPAPPAPCRLASPLTMQRIADHLLDRHARVERGERILEDQPHFAMEAAQLLLAEPGDIDLRAIACRGRVTVPVVGSTVRRIRRPSVVLPEPLSPTMPRFSPG